MRKLFVFFSAAVFSACFVTGCSNNTQEQHADTQDHHEGHTHSAAAPAGTDPKNIDPICDMVRDETWTDYMVYNNDSVWFCSEYCKDAFAANPEKYRH